MYEPEDLVTDDTERPGDLGFYGIILDSVVDDKCEKRPPTP